jgi:hypothetical protein
VVILQQKKFTFGQIFQIVFMKNLLIVISLFGFAIGFAQNTGYWQQHADYKMEVSMDVKTYRYKGKQELVYTNNSPDTLRKVYYHLYPNAFQPGSEMDMRARSIKDPDKRFMKTIKTADGKEVKESRFKTLKPEEIGFLKISNFKQDGVSASIKESETILEVVLAKPILPSEKTTFTLDFDGQVPVQIRRSGRNNVEGVELSMSQWYPKLAEYDFEGWHPDPYIAREFFGVWGNFDVKITIDKDYVLGGTGYLQNKNEIGYGYQDKGIVVKHPKTKTLIWHFMAPNVHDFTWAADKDYLHDVIKGPNDVDLHFLYKNNPKIIDNWKNFQPIMVKVMDIFNKTVGNYPYKQYSFIQGGDGGMEYAMCTLMLGNGTLSGMTTTGTHEFAHSWFQQILGSNESKHSWMDEGFATYIEDMALNEIAEKKSANPYLDNYTAYFNVVNSGKEQPQTTQADRYDENRPYTVNSYFKGQIFLSQLEYVIGKDLTRKGLKQYYKDFKFKHPAPNDIKRVMEKVSGAELDWYLTDWTQTTNTIDYAIKGVTENQGKTTISLMRIGRMPMPIDIAVEYTDGTIETFIIPLRMMHHIKQNPTPQFRRTVLKDWAWGNPNYDFTIEGNKAIKSITIDPSGMMADVKPENNVYPGK